MGPDWGVAMGTSNYTGVQSGVGDLSTPSGSQRSATGASVARIASQKSTTCDTKGVVLRVPREGLGFVSPIDLKSNGSIRVILNLKSLNKFVRTKCSKMEMLSDILP